MRCLFYAVFVVALVHLNALTAYSDNSEKFSLNIPALPSVETTSVEEPSRLLRLGDEVDDALKSVSASKQVRKLRANRLAEKLKSTSTAKKLLATAKKTSSSLKKVPGVKSIQKRILYNRLSRWAKQGKRPEDLKKAGKFKNNDEFAAYQVILNMAKGKKAAP